MIIRPPVFGRAVIVRGRNSRVVGRCLNFLIPVSVVGVFARPRKIGVFCQITVDMINRLGPLMFGHGGLTADFQVNLQKIADIGFNV